MLAISVMVPNPKVHIAPWNQDTPRCSMSNTVESSESILQPKRKRTSKPKVKTGCITCKIRRVKCDERKPACLRCTSTGRTCDGYEDPSVKKKKKEASPSSCSQDSDELQHACSGDPDPQLFHPHVANLDLDISPLVTNSQTAAAISASFRSLVISTFCQLLASQIKQHDDAVKHALMALSSARRILHKSQQCPLSELPELELFTITQYNNSISALQRHITSPSAESMEVTLVCCLLYIGIEAARGNEEGASAHLSKGVQLLSSFSSGMVQPVYGYSGIETSGAGRRLSREEWRQLIDSFATLQSVVEALRVSAEGTLSVRFGDA
ncbi:hypothetical protein BX600DRAFT_7855 [Xylariales sp. PMI_506]|nr:hypothetical protein BX600DRAFT_7855 [Xylariales sp. PMI_506]